MYKSIQAMVLSSFQYKQQKHYTLHIQKMDMSLIVKIFIKYSLICICKLENDTHLARPTQLLLDRQPNDKKVFLIRQHTLGF